MTDYNSQQWRRPKITLAPVRIIRTTLWWETTWAIALGSFGVTAGIVAGIYWWVRP